VHTIGSTKAEIVLKYRLSLKEAAAMKHEKAIGISAPTAMTGTPRNNTSTRDRGTANNAMKRRNRPVAAKVGHIKKSRGDCGRPDLAAAVDIAFLACFIKIVLSLSIVRAIFATCICRCGVTESVPHNISRKSGIAMAAPGSIMTKLPYRLERQEADKDFDPRATACDRLTT
jgi:hypothetical protein